MIVLTEKTGITITGELLEDILDVPAIKLNRCHDVQSLGRSILVTPPQVPASKVATVEPAGSRMRSLLWASIVNVAASG